MKSAMQIGLRNRLLASSLVGFLALCMPLSAATFTSRSEFAQALGGGLMTVDFEGFTSLGGQAGAVALMGDEFEKIKLAATGEAEGLYVGIPDSSVTGDNWATFFGIDFHPTSGRAVLSPALNDLGGAYVPSGTVIVDFELPVLGVGAYLLDVESGVSSIEVFDGPGGTGSSLDYVSLQYQGQASQSFVGVSADGISSAVIVLGDRADGVGMDDLCYAIVPEPATLLVLGIGGVLVARRRL